MKVQFILAACVTMMIGTLIYMYQAAQPLNVDVIPPATVASQEPSPPMEATQSRHAVTGDNDDVKISNHQAHAGL